MKRSLTLSFAFAATILGFALTSSASAQVATTPEPALAAVFAEQSLPQTDLMPKPTLKCGLMCIPRIQHTTPTISGSGSNCTNATNSLNTQLHDIASNDCVNVRFFDGTCNIVIHYTTACTLIGSGAYQIQGYATYACSINNC